MLMGGSQSTLDNGHESLHMVTMTLVHTRIVVTATIGRVPMALKAMNLAKRHSAVKKAHKAKSADLARR